MSWTRINVARWVALAVIGLAAARFSRKTASRKTVRRETFASRGRYLVPAAVLGVVLTSAGIAAAWLDARFVPDAAWVGVLSAAITAAGVALALWAHVTLGKSWRGTLPVKLAPFVW